MGRIDAQALRRMTIPEKTSLPVRPGVEPDRARGRTRVSVLMVADHLGYPGGIIHGASRYYEQVLPRLDRTRFSICLCILGMEHPFARTLERLEIRPIFLNRRKWDVRAMHDLLRLAHQTRPHVLHCLTMKGCLLGRLTGIVTGAPSVIHLHDTNEPGPLVGFLQRCLAPWTARALAVSDVVRNHAITRFGIPPQLVETLHNGLDLETFATPSRDARIRIRGELGIPVEAFVILVAGRVVESKGQHLLIGLVPEILRAQPHVRLLVVGDGPNLSHCRELAAALGVTNVVYFAGHRSDIPDLLAAADTAAVPSLEEEGFGYTALEAAAAGKPVVAFQAGAMQDIIADGLSGRVLRRGDACAMAEALAWLATNRAIAARMGRAAIARARRFGIDHHVHRLESLYSELAAGHSSVRASEVGAASAAILRLTAPDDDRG